MSTRRGGPEVTSVLTGVTGEIDPRLLEHRRELTGYCYRMLGSSFDADDAVQETMVRAWRGLADFEGRSALRDRKSTRLNSSHANISYAVFCLKKKNNTFTLPSSELPR